MDNLFFVISKVAWLFTAPGSLLLLLALAGLLCLFLGRLRAARVLLTVPIAIFTLIACLPLDEWLAHPLETRFPTNPPLPEHVDGILVLGGALMPPESLAWEQVELNDAAERNFALLTLARRFPEARLAFTGGSGRLLNQEATEAAVMQNFLHQLGIAPETVEIEGESRNTWENAINSRALLRPAPGERWLLVTSAYHMPRAMGAFCQAGWPMLPWPVDHRSTPGRALRLDFDLSHNLALFTTAYREWLGLAAYYFSGRSTSLFPATCPQE